MVKKFFKNRRKEEEAPPEPAGPPSAPVDEDETIVINLSGKGASEKPAVTLEQPSPPDVPPKSDQPPAKPLLLEGGQDETQVYIPPSAQTTATDEPAGVSEESSRAAPPEASGLHVAGYLAVSSPEYRGLLYTVELGRNSIGRGPDNALSVDNGDATIARTNHAAIAADPVSKKFYAVPGESRNLAYHNGKPILEAQELSNGDKLQLGNTEFVFIQFLGNYVDWE